MSLAIQILMGTSLAACAGLRAWLPLLIVGLLARTGALPLNPMFEFVGSDAALVVFGVATAVELLADKLLAVDHFLDAVSTFVRPAAGTVLAAAVLVKLDPLMAVVLGLIIGGGASLTVHAGKAAARANVSTLAPVHAGAGNAAVSLGEDLFTGFAVWLATHAPIIAFVLTVAILGLAVWLVIHFTRKGAGLVRSLRRDA